MCSIGGWIGSVSISRKEIMLQEAQKRGRDGFGIWTSRGELRGIDYESAIDSFSLDQSYRAVFNYRAAPTTEPTNDLSLLQPYDGIVHNGTVANHANFGKFRVDSMALPVILSDRGFDKIAHNCSQIKGGFALAYCHNNGLIIAANYKPIYYYYDKDQFIFGSLPSMIGNLRAIKMKPYTAIHYKNGQIFSTDLIREPQNKRVLLSASSGLDSTTVAYILKSMGYQVTLVYFQYGCNAEERELTRLEKIAMHGKFDLEILQLPRIFNGTIVNGTYNTDQKFGVRYAADWVSARNLLMLSTLTAYAETYDYSFIAYGGNLEESGSYPDNEWVFGEMFNELMSYSIKPDKNINLIQPLSNYMKHEIVKVGLSLKVPYDLTWSCYSNEEKHCGKCSPCYMRKVAFERNKIVDPVEYMNS